MELQNEISQPEACNHNHEIGQDLPIEVGNTLPSEFFNNTLHLIKYSQN